MDDACDLSDDKLEKWREEYEASRKEHEPHFEISIAWDDDDEFEHEGYYNSVDDAIEALLKYKKVKCNLKSEKGENDLWNFCL